MQLDTILLTIGSGLLWLGLLTISGEVIRSQLKRRGLQGDKIDEVLGLHVIIYVGASLVLYAVYGL